MDSELKGRIIAFIGSLDDHNLSGEQVSEANSLYGLLTRKPGRQPGFKPSKKEARQLLADAGPDGKELAS